MCTFQSTGKLVGPKTSIKKANATEMHNIRVLYLCALTTKGVSPVSCLSLLALAVSTRPGGWRSISFTGSIDPRIYYELLHLTGEFPAWFMIIATLASPLGLLLRGWKSPLAFKRSHFNQSSERIKTGQVHFITLQGTQTIAPLLQRRDQRDLLAVLRSSKLRALLWPS